MTPHALKFVAVAALATVAACSCIDAPELDVASKPVARKFDGSQTVVATQQQPQVMPERITTPTEPKAETRALVVMPTEPVFFGFDSAQLSVAEQAKITQVARYMQANNITNVTVEGHCDERGTREYNLALGDRRAVAVKRFLVTQGVPAQNIRTVSFGKERPAMQGHTEAAWAKNRRGEFKF